MRVLAALLAAFWGAAAYAEGPNGSVEGAVQYRNATGTAFSADDDIRIVPSPGFQLLNGKLLYVHQPSTSNYIQVVDFGTAGSGAFTAFQVDGTPSNDVIITYPVSGRSGSPNVPLTVLFREDLDSVGELSTRIGADSTAANRLLASPSGASGALSLRALANADLAGLSPTLAGLTLSSGTTNGLLYRISSGAVQSSSNILAVGATLELRNGTILKQVEPIGNVMMQTITDTKTVNLLLDGAPSGTANVRFPVAGLSGERTVLIKQDLDTQSEFDSLLNSTGAPAATNLLSGGNAWLNLGTINERTTPPATPASGFGEIWIDSGGMLRVIDDGGVDHALVNFVGTVADLDDGARFDILTSDPAAVANRPMLYFRDDTQATPTPHPFIRDDTGAGIYQIVREPAAGITTGQVPVKQADGSYAGSTLSDGHDALSIMSRADDSKSHQELYELAMPTDVDSMGEHSGHPDANVACQDGSPDPEPDQRGRRQLRTHGGILWQARTCTDTVGTSKWQPINEVYLGHYFSTSASTATGCVSFASDQAGQLVANCNTDATNLVFGRDFLLTRVVARDTEGATNNSGGSPCKVQLWKNANTADPNTDVTHGTKLLTTDDTASMAGTSATAKTWAIWDIGSEPKADWTFDLDDRLDIEFDDGTCNGNNVQLIVDLWGVPLG